MRLYTVLLTALALSACSGDDKTIRIGGPVECDVTEDSLAGTQWVMWEAKGTENRENPLARAKFYEEDGKLKVKYTVKSPWDVYEYECKRDDSNSFPIVCREKTKIEDWCRALESYEEGSCSVDKLKEFGANDVTDEELAKGVENAKKEVAEWRAKGDQVFAGYARENNFLGNKLQGQFEAKLNTKKCQLLVSDNYMTIYNGKMTVDSNPVGTNPFVQTKQDWMYEHCDQAEAIVEWDSAELPEDLNELGKCMNPRVPCFQEIGNEVYFHYIGQRNREGGRDLAGVKAEEGCTYSMNTYAAMKQVGKDIAVTPDGDGNVTWMASHKFEASPELELIFDGQQSATVFSMQRNKTCGGKTEEIDTACTVVYFP